MPNTLELTDVVIELEEGDMIVPAGNRFAVYMPTLTLDISGSEALRAEQRVEAVRDLCTKVSSPLQRTHRLFGAFFDQEEPTVPVSAVLAILDGKS